MLQYSPKIITDSLVMCLDASNNKSYPTDLPVKNGLNLWLDAADDTTFSYSSGTSVSQWRDKSGSNFHASQATVGSQPSRSTFQNSRKTVNFDGTNDTVTIPSFVSNSEMSIFVVSNCGTSLIIEHSTNANSNQGFYFYGGGTGMIYINRATGGSIIITSDWLSGGYSIAGAVNSTGLDLLTYKNGTQQSITTDGRGFIANTYITNTLYIGSRGANSLWSSGPIAEIIIYNRKVTDTERKQIHTYLGQKWGISNTDRSVINLAGGFTDPWLLGVGDGATNNMPTYSPYNKTFVFDGSNDIISYPNALGTFGSYTFSFWARRNVESKMAFSSYGNAAFYWFGDSSWAYTHGGVFGEKYYNKAVSIPLGSYGHYCVTYDGAAVRIYRNGVFEDSQATTGTAVFNVGLQLGRFGADAVNYAFSGDIANFLMYTRALSAAEVQQNYESQKARFANYIVTSGLVLNLDAGNIYSYAGAGTTIYDVSATALSWTGSNVTYNSDPIKYFSYNGSSSWLQSSTSTAYDSQTITMECWCYPNTLSQEGFLFEKGSVNTQYSMFFESITSPNFVFRTMGTVSNYNLSFNVNTYLTVSAWNHIVCTYNGSSKISYVNGVQVASVAASGTLPTGQVNQYIGRHTGGYFFNGRIAESRVYNTALSAAQVLQNYNATKGRFGLL